MGVLLSTPAPARIPLNISDADGSSVDCLVFLCCAALFREGMVVVADALRVRFAELLVLLFVDWLTDDAAPMTCDAGGSSSTALRLLPTSAAASPDLLAVISSSLSESSSLLLP